MRSDRVLKDIKRALLHYPRLELIEKGKKIKVLGEIDLVHPETGKFDEYSVCIQFTSEYPSCFPKVEEISNKIPMESDRHVNPDKSLCLAIEPQEKWLCRNGISFKYFLDKILVQHLSRETYRDRAKTYPDGEYSHGIKGFVQYYKEILGSKSDQELICELENVSGREWPGRNDNCSCGSLSKFKHCHADKWERVNILGKQYLKANLERIINYIGNER